MFLSVNLREKKTNSTVHDKNFRRIRSFSAMSTDLRQDGPRNAFVNSGTLAREARAAEHPGKKIR